MRLSFACSGLAKGLLAAWLALLMGQAGCRPAGSRHRTGGPVIDQTLQNATAVSFEQPIELRAYLTDLMETLAAKRHEKHIVALEPLEAASSVAPVPAPSRMYAPQDPTELYFRGGEELFETELTVLDSFGDGMGGNQPNKHRIHRGAHGGPDAGSCRSCHHRGGDDGAGEFGEAALTGGDGEHVASANARNPPALHGGGALQILAHEISADLQKALRESAVQPGGRIALTVQGVYFGTVIQRPDKTYDTSGLSAIDPDMIVRPFGWKGTHSTLRRFAEEAFQVHHGLQSMTLLRAKQGVEALPRDASDASRAVLSSLGDGTVENPDRDRLNQELSAGQMLAMSVYLTLLPLPVTQPPRSPELMAAWRDGMVAFQEIGCHGCHKPSWQIREPVWIERGEYPQESIALTLDLRKDIRNGPPLRHLDKTINDIVIFPFSDLRRHDMGPELADRGTGPGSSLPPHVGDHRGPSIAPSYFLTRPLWGLADSAPYLHDGRAHTLHDAIAMHGGEANDVRAAYLALPAARQRALQIFLYSLTRPMFPEATP